MQRRGFAALFVFIIGVLSMCILALAQGQSNGEKIELIRQEIKKRETAAVPADLVELNRKRLDERRNDLRTLLLAEIENLRKYRSDLGTLLTPEETKKIDDAIRAYDDEANGLLAVHSANSTRQSAAQPQPSPSPPATATPVVASAAGAPTPCPAATPLPAVTKASEETEGKADTLNCTDVLAVANAKVYSELDKTICRLGAAIRIDRKANQLPKNRLLLHGSQAAFDLVKIIIAKKYTPAFMVEAEEKRLDKQVGSAPSSSGSTSLVTKGGAPDILAFAVENGALSKSVSGSAITFRGNPVGVYNALANNGFVTAAKANQQDPLLHFLKKTSFAFTFNTDRGSQPGTFTATKQQLAAVSGRIEFINNRKPELYVKDWENFLDTNAAPLTLAIDKLQLTDTRCTNEDVFPHGQWFDPMLQAWFVTTQTALGQASDSEVDTVLQDRIQKLPIKELSPDSLAKLDQIEKLMGLYSTGRGELLSKINKGTLVTFDYLNKREVNAPNTSTFTFIAEKGTGGGKLDFTFNGSATIFDNLGSLRNFVKLHPTLPPARRFRDFQFAGQIDVPMGNVREFGEFVFFAGGRYERLLANTSDELGLVLPNTKGDIGVLQLGLKVPLKGTGFKIPFSITFANRTELIKEREVRGNFGLTLDLDTLFAKYKPF